MSKEPSIARLIYFFHLRHIYNAFFFYVRLALSYWVYTFLSAEYEEKLGPNISNALLLFIYSVSSTCLSKSCIGPFLLAPCQCFYCWSWHLIFTSLTGVLVPLRLFLLPSSDISDFWFKKINLALHSDLTWPWTNHWV